MQVSQILKDEKVSIIEFLCFYIDTFQLRNARFLANWQSHYRFLIKRLAFKIKKQSRLKHSEKEKNVNYLAAEREQTNSLLIEICSEKMNTLLAQRQICAADIRCLDTSSKQCLKSLCLKTCLYNTAHSNPAPQLLDELKPAASLPQIKKQ